MRVYISAGWFNDSDMAMVEHIESLLEEWGFEYHSPRLHTDQPQMVGDEETFLQNIAAIKKCKTFLMPVGDTWDEGAIMELGAAYVLGKFIILYHYTDHNKVNLMLAVPACHAGNERDLKDLLYLSRTANSRMRRNHRHTYGFEGATF